MKRIVETAPGIAAARGSALCKALTERGFLYIKPFAAPQQTKPLRQRGMCIF
jgi:hypothetical protein